MSKSKELTLLATPKKSESALDKVDVNPGEKLDANALIELGRLRESMSAARISNFRFTKRLAKIKFDKLFIGMGFPSFEAFVTKIVGVSVDTVDNHIKSCRALPPEAEDLGDIIDFSADAYGRVNPVILDGNVFIGTRKFSLTKQNATVIQQAFDEQNRELRKKSEEASSTKVELDKARKERDSATKAAASANERLRAAQHPPLFDGADEGHKTLLHIQSNWDRNLVMLTVLARTELSIENEARYLGLLEHIYRSLVQITDESRFAFGRGANANDPSDALYLNSTEDKGRDLIAEFTAAQKGGAKK